MKMLEEQIKELREAAFGIQGDLGRCLYRRKDVDKMLKFSDLLFEAANTIERLQELQGVTSESRHTELFGTPERAARTICRQLKHYKPNFDNVEAVEMDASRFKAVEMDASRLVAREPDSREKLESDMREWWRVGLPGIQEKAENVINYNEVIKWLDRQEIITLTERCKRERELGEAFDELTAERDNLEANNQQLHTLAGEQAATIDELTAERNELQTRVYKLTADLFRTDADCERYKAKIAELTAHLYREIYGRKRHHEKSDKGDSGATDF